MSTFDIHYRRHNGFIKDYWASKEYPYHNCRITSAQPHFMRFVRRHKHSTYQVPYKQFDVRFLDYCKYFYAKSSLAPHYRLPCTVWRFARGHHLSTKFQYTNR